MQFPVYQGKTGNFLAHLRSGTGCFLADSLILPAMGDFPLSLMSKNNSEFSRAIREFEI